LTEIFFTQAIDRARELDEIYIKSGKPTRALFGMPISLKDQFEIKGTGNNTYRISIEQRFTLTAAECNMGIASWVGHISQENSVLVDILQDAGAM